MVIYTPVTGDRIAYNYDTEQGFARWLVECQGIASKRNVRVPPPCFAGYKTLTGLLPPNTIDTIRNALDLGDPILQSESFRYRFIEELLTTPGLDTILRGYFQADYLPLWCRFHKNNPDEENLPPAIGWHCDGGPSKHLKLLLYLNSSNDCHGYTAMLSFSATHILKQYGYIFCSLEKRCESLSDIADTLRIPISCLTDGTYVFNAYEPGDGLLFEPYHIGHCAIWPKGPDPRYMVQVCFIANCVPWHTIELGSAYFLSDSNSWPRVLAPHTGTGK